MQGKRVLLVDDEEIILQNLYRELSAEDLDVRTAGSGEEALTAMRSQRFDLVVTDLLMPGLDGFQVLKAAKQRHQATMVIILTGFGDMETAIDALRLGADDFLQKPCDVEELLYRMSNCLEKQDLKRKVAMYEQFLPICSHCKKVRDDREAPRGQGQWYTLEEYFKRVQGVWVSHGICPHCYAQLMEEKPDAHGTEASAGSG